jgi:hypothetical protein
MFGSTFLLIYGIQHGDATHIPPHLRKPLDRIKAIWRQFRDISVTTEDSIAARFIQVIRVARCTTFFFRRSDDMSHRLRPGNCEAGENGTSLEANERINTSSSRLPLFAPSIHPGGAMGLRE